MAQFPAEVSINGLRGIKVMDGAYAMEDGKIYGESAGTVEEADGYVDIPEAALRTARIMVANSRLYEDKTAEESPFDEGEGD
jgi:hypothetical protein